MGNISVVVRDYDGLAGTLSLLKAIDECMGNEEVDLILVGDHSSQIKLDVKGKRAKRLTVGPDTLDTGQALNVGAQAAEGDVIVFTIGDTVPIGSMWLEAANRCIAESLVAGVCGPILPTAAASVFRRAYGRMRYLGAKLVGRRRVDSLPFRGFSPLNMAIRRSLWSCHPFQPVGDAASSVEEWAQWAMGQGLDLIYDCAFAVQCEADAGWPFPVDRVSISHQTPSGHMRDNAP